MRRTASTLIGAVTVALVAGIPGVAGAATGWTLQSVPLPAGAQGGELGGVSCLTAASCIATLPSDVQPPTVERWNGSAWSVQSLPFPPAQNAALVAAISCASATACTATGRYFTGAGEPVMMAERWNGSTWSVQTVPEPPGAAFDAGTLTGVSCASATSCVAVGDYFTGGPGTEVPLAEHWNGSAWRVLATAPLPPGSGASFFFAVSCSSATSCTAVGATGNNVTSPLLLAEHWNGSSWAIQATPPPPGGLPAFFGGVSCTSPANCTAVGATGVSGQNEVPVAEHWNGSKWAVQAIPLPSGALAGALNAVSCPATGACTAAGWFSDSIARTAGHTALAEFWNGTAWTVQQTAQPPSRKTFNAISCVAARTCTAVGVTVLKTSTFVQPLAEHE